MIPPVIGRLQEYIHNKTFFLHTYNFLKHSMFFLLKVIYCPKEIKERLLKLTAFNKNEQKYIL